MKRTKQKGKDFNKSGGLMGRNMILGVLMAVAAVLIFAPAAFAYSSQYSDSAIDLFSPKQALRA